MMFIFTATFSIVGASMSTQPDACSAIANPSTALLGESKGGNLTGVELILNNCNETDVNVADYSGGTPLIWASINGHSRIVEILLKEEGIEVNGVMWYDGTWATALYFASHLNHYEIVEMLLQLDDIDVNKRNYYYGKTALYRASSDGHPDIVRLLLQRPEIDINLASSNHKRTPLYKASQKGRTEVAKLLLERPEVEVNLADDDEYTPLNTASEGGHSKIVRMLLSHPKTDVNKDAKGMTSLWLAFHTGQKEIVQLILDYPDVNVAKGKTMDAKGHLEIRNLLFDDIKRNVSLNEEFMINVVVENATGVELLLLNNDTDVNFVDNGGRTPLIWATNNGNLEIVQLLINCSNLEVNKQRNSDGKSALSLATCNCKSNITKLLLGHAQIEVNQVDSDGKTSLYKVSKEGQTEIVELLLGHGNIDINKADPDYGKTPLYKASENGHLSVVTLLLKKEEIMVNQATITRETPLMAASRNGFPKVVRELLAYATINVNFATFEGETAIMYAFEANGVEQKQIIELILRCPGTDISLMDEDYQTARDHAKEYNQTGIMKLFDERVMLTKKKGQTCCSDIVNDGLQRSSEVGDLAMVKSFLMCPKVDLNIGYKYSRTPLYIASFMNHTEVVAVILNDSRTDVNLVVNSDNALFTASEKGHTEIVLLLIKHPHIDVNNKNKRSRKTALIIAAENHHIGIIKVLLKHSQTFVNEIDIKYQTALSVAVSKGFLRVVKLMLRCPKTHRHMEGIEIDTSFKNDVSQALKSVQLFHLMNATCCLNVTERLLRAAWVGDFRAIRGLLQCPGSESNVNVVDNKGRTPLYIAAMMGHLDAVIALINNTSIDLEIGAKLDGITPFAVASIKSHFDIMKELILHGQFDKGKKENGWCKDNWTRYASLCKTIHDAVPETPTIETTELGASEYIFI